MWKYPPFLSFLKDLVKFHMVDEVIIINNNIIQMPNDDILDHPKVRMISMPNNIFVNPAWNMGVAEARNSKVCILNDDLIFDLKCFYHVDSVLAAESGVVGICPGMAEFQQPPFVSGAVQILPWKDQHTFGFGCLMFVHKDWYIPVPQGLEIYYGDNWIFDTCLVRGRTNYIITDLLYCTPFAATTKGMGNVDDRLEREGNIYRPAFDAFRAAHSQTA